MAIKAKHPGKDIACNTQMLHYCLLVRWKSKHTQPYTHTEINQQKSKYSGGGWGLSFVEITSSVDK